MALNTNNKNNLLLLATPAAPWVAFSLYKTRDYMLKDAKEPTKAKMIESMQNDINTNAIDWMKNKEGYKINSSVSNDTLIDQRDSIQIAANNLGAKTIDKIDALNKKYQTKFPKVLQEHLSQRKNGTLGSKEFIDLFDTYFAAKVNDVVAQYMNEELVLREKFQKKVDSQLTSTSINSLESLKKEARSPDQVNQIQARIDDLKEEEARKKAIADAEKKLAQAKTDEEKKQAQAELDTLISQGSKAVGTLSGATGIPKGALYIGIGVAVVIAGVLIYRGIRK